MKITINQVVYEQFQAFMLAYEAMSQDVRKLYTEYQPLSSPVLMNAAGSKEYHEHEQKLNAIQHRTYRFGQVVLENVFVTSYKAIHDNRFKIKDGHVVPIYVDLEIEFSYWLG